MSNVNPESIRLAQTVVSLPSRQQAIVRRLLIRMLNPPTARSDEEVTAALAEMVAKCKAAGPPEVVEASVQAFMDWCNGKGGYDPADARPPPSALGSPRSVGHSSHGGAAAGTAGACDARPGA